MRQVRTFNLTIIFRKPYRDHPEKSIKKIKLNGSRIAGFIIFGIDLILTILLTTIILTSVLKFVYERGEGGIMITTSKILALLTFGNRFEDPVSASQLAFLFGLISITMFGWMTIARVTRGNILMVKYYDYPFAALSFLGLGMPEGYADWGQMLSLARNWIPSLAEFFYIAIYPGIAIVLFVLSWNLVGDALRDVLDPRLRNTGSDLS